MIIIDEKSLKKAELALARLIKVSTVTENGITWKDNFTFNQCLYILSHAIKIDVMKEYDRKENLVRLSFNLFRRGNDSSLDKFKKILEESLERHYLSKGNMHFCVLFQLNINPTALRYKRFFSLLNNKIYFHTWKSVNKKFDLVSFNEQARSSVRKLHQISLHDYSWFEIIGSGKDIGEAFQSAYDTFELFRAILNFSNNCFVVTNYMSRSLHHSNSFLPSPFYIIFNDNKSYNQYRYELSSFEYKKNDLSSFFKEDIFRKLLTLLSAKPSTESLKGMVLEAILKYGTALDSLYPDVNFLKAWQVLELITFHSEKSSIKNVGDKIKLLFGQDELWGYTIDVICELRNSIVHKGVFSEEGYEKLSILKHVVESCIYCLVNLCRSLKARSDLEIFYQLDSHASGDLKKRIKIANSILLTRCSRKHF